MNIFLRSFLLFLATTLASCKVVIQTPPEGSVSTESGRYFCDSGTTCEIDIRNTDFFEIFLANPGQGYRFSKWELQRGYLCGGNSSACPLDVRPLASLENAQAFINADVSLYLKPVFEQDPLYFSLHQYQPGQKVVFRETLRGIDSSGESEAEVETDWEFLSTSTVYQGNLVIALQKTVRLPETDVSLKPDTSLFFQDSNGSWFNLKFNADAGTSLFDTARGALGSMWIPSPLLSFTVEFVEYANAVDGSHLTRGGGEATIVVEDRERVSVPLGDFDAIKVTYTGVAQSFLAGNYTEIAQVIWISSHKGIVKISETYTNYEVWNIESIQYREAEAISTNF